MDVKKLLDSIKAAKFLDHISDCQLLKKDYSTELFSYISIINSNFTAKLHLKRETMCTLLCTQK
jgi:hypothetical protein